MTENFFECLMRKGFASAAFVEMPTERRLNGREDRMRKTFGLTFAREFRGTMPFFN